jgi:N-acetylglutamate synthase-like GNAT family acetyltransferase
MIKIQNLKDVPEHLTTLANWHHKQWYYLNPDESIDQRIKRMQPFLNDDLIPGTFIAEEDNELLGSAALVEHDMETKPELSPWLASVYVAPSHRRKGVGTQLVLHVMMQARLAGIDTLYLFTPDKVTFYHKLGWRLVCSEQYHNHRVSIMQAHLSETNIHNNA